MSRNLKRVPLDFAWPLNTTWGGYLNPFYGYSTKCPPCEGTGYSVEARRLQDQWYGNAPFRPEQRGSQPFQTDHPKVRAFAEHQVTRSPEFYGYGEAAIEREAHRLCLLWNKSWSHHLNAADVAALLAEDRLWEFTRRPRTEAQKETLGKSGQYWLPEGNGYVPTPEEVNEWSIDRMGHDSTNQYIVVKAECERQGVPLTCAACAGEGHIWISPKAKRQAERWKDVEPPDGPGFQLWEDVSEGSPQSPVFASLDELCTWAAANATTFGSQKATAEQWREMLGDGGIVHHQEGNTIFL